MTTPEEFRSLRETRIRVAKVQAKLRRDGMAEFVAIRHDGGLEFDVARMPMPKVRVYFIRCQQFIKIGLTTHWKNRLTVIQTANPFALEPLALFEGGAEEEARLHKLFAEHRYRADGEWFHDCQPIRGYIAANKEKCLLEAQLK
jgi:hypothetical protein